MRIREGIFRPAKATSTLPANRSRIIDSRPWHTEIHVSRGKGRETTRGRASDEPIGVFAIISSGVVTNLLQILETDTGRLPAAANDFSSIWKNMIRVPR